MLEFAHALTGAVIASKVSSPILSLPLAFLSHFVIDYLPHWNPSLSKDKKKYGHISAKSLLLVSGDCLLGLILVSAIGLPKLPNIKNVIIVFLGAFMGVLPDLLEAPYYFFKGKTLVLKGLMKFQGDHQFNVSFWLGILFQAFYTSLLLLYAFTNL